MVRKCVLRILHTNMLLTDNANAPKVSADVFLPPYFAINCELAHFVRYIFIWFYVEIAAAYCLCSGFQGTWIASIHGHTCCSLKDLLLVICAFSYWNFPYIDKSCNFMILLRGGNSLYFLIKNLPIVKQLMLSWCGLISLAISRSITLEKMQSLNYGHVLQLS